MTHGPDDRGVRVIYAGRVQRVGFRWTVSRIAARHRVDGFVRNLPDGTVELVAQGAPHVVTAFLAEVASSMGRHIENSDSAEVSIQEDLAGFHIRH